jgi:hypothetical protein
VDLQENGTAQPSIVLSMLGTKEIANADELIADVGAAVYGGK